MAQILVIEPFYGGSHRSFIDSLINHSRHDWKLLTLPARHWKWRMRNTPLAIAEQVNSALPEVDVVFVTDYVKFMSKYKNDYFSPISFLEI